MSSKKMAIAMFGQKRLSREGGIEIVVKELCTRMAKNGYTVTWGTPVGVSPIMVITSEPYSQIRCVVVIQGTKRMGNVTS